VDDAIELMQEQLQLLAEIEVLKEQIELLEEELLDVRARVKLFENRRIPNAKLAIRKIGQKLQDDERLTIATAKVVKTSKQMEGKL
jgi:V/A-type H+-transporting ATPase subunit D